MDSKLTQRQKMFADEYIICGNAEAAAKKAGYNSRGNTTKLLQNTNIKNYINEVNNTIHGSKIATMQEVREFWAETMRDLKGDKKDRLKASEYIAKTNGAFIEQHNIQGSISVNIVDDLDEDIDEDMDDLDEDIIGGATNDSKE